MPSLLYVTSVCALSSPKCGCPEKSKKHSLALGASLGEEIRMVGSTSSTYVLSLEALAPSFTHKIGIQ